MAEYIEREKIWPALNAACVPYNRATAKAIESIPTTDMRPVVRGKWKPRDLTYGRNYYFCSACEETVDMPTAMGIPMFRYCPNCGAKMKEGE